MKFPYFMLRRGLHLEEKREDPEKGRNEKIDRKRKGAIRKFSNRIDGRAELQNGI